MRGNTSIELASGKLCKFIRIRRDLIPHYYILAFPKSQGDPSKEEVSEMITLGIEYAKSIAKQYVGDSEAYTLLYSGYSARREKGWHIHIVLLGNRWKKAWLYLVLSGKNILQGIGLRNDDSPRIER